MTLFIAVSLAYFSAAAAQDADREAINAMVRGEREVVATERQQDRFETDHLILYVDKGVLSAAAERPFVEQLERDVVAVANLLQRQFDAKRSQTGKPVYYLTDRAGISHVTGARVFLRAARVVPSPAIAVHETAHLLLGAAPDAPRSLPDTPPEIDATTGVWLAEGFASHVDTELAPRLGLQPDHLFLRGDGSTLDAESIEWLKDPRGKAVVPYIGSRGYPKGLDADRVNVATPLYVLSQSFVRYLVSRAGLLKVAQLYVDHFGGRTPIEDDVRRVTGVELARWRADWLKTLGQ